MSEQKNLGRTASGTVVSNKMDKTITVQHDSIGADVGERLRFPQQVPFARRAREHEVDLVRAGGVQTPAQLVEPAAVAGRASRGIDQDDVTIVERVNGLLHLGRGQRHLQRETDDVGVRAELIDGGDPVRITRDQAHLAMLLELELRRQLGEGRRLAHARGSDEGDGQRAVVGSAAGHRRVRRRNEIGQAIQHRCPEGIGVVPSHVGKLFADGVDDPVRQLLGEVLADELEVDLEERLGHVGTRTRSRPRLLLEDSADHRLDRGELLLHGAGRDWSAAAVVQALLRFTRRPSVPARRVGGGKNEAPGDRGGWH